MLVWSRFQAEGWQEVSLASKEVNPNRIYIQELRGDLRRNINGSKRRYQIPRLPQRISPRERMHLGYQCTGRFEDNSQFSRFPRWSHSSTSHFIIFITCKKPEGELKSAGNGECNYDFVEFELGENQVKRYCGSTVPPIMTSENKSMRIRFKSDESVNKMGFSASYAFVTGFEKASLY